MLTASSTFNVADQAPVVAMSTAIVEPPVGAGTGGKGRLEHPILGAYDYLHAPTETVNLDGDVCFPPTWSHAETLGGGADALWPGYIRDVVVTERWAEGNTGGPLAHLRALWALFVNPPDPADGFVIWRPNYATARAYKVALVSLTAGGDGYRLDRMLLKSGAFAPSPVELKLRVIGYAD